MRLLRLLPMLPLLVCLLLSVVAMSGCKRDAEPTGKAGTPGTTAAGAATVDGGGIAAIADDTTPPPELGDFRVTSVLLGDSLDAEQLVRAAKADFDARATIHASVFSTGAHPGLTLAARYV